MFGLCVHACLLRIYPDSLAIIAISRQAAESDDQFKPYLAGLALLSGTENSKSSTGSAGQIRETD